MSGPSRVVTALRQVLEHRERERAPVRTERVVGRNEDGTLQVQRLDAECVVTSGVDNFYEGQVVQRPPSSPISRQGLTGAASVREEEETPTLWVERLEPDTYQPGQSYVVGVIGRGFTPEIRFNFLEPPTGFQPPRTINGGITIETVAFVDSENFELEISVASDARLYERAPLAYGRP